MKDKNRYDRRREERDDVDHRRPKETRKKRQDPKLLIRAGRYEELYDQED